MNKKNTIFFSIVAIISITLVSCKIAVSPRTEQVLGTICTVNAYSDGTEKLYNEIFTRLENIEKIFSVNIETSEISKINKSAGDAFVETSEEVIYVLKEALMFAELSDGAFDPTIGPLVKLWGINTDHARVPEQKEIDQVLPLVNYKNVKIEDDKVLLTKKNMSLDLGGIAKGYAADEVVKILKKNKVNQAVIDLGGNIYVYGIKKDKSPWKVGIKNPNDDEGEPALILTLKEGTSVVTSGVYERFFVQNGKLYHHILNTKSGMPAESGMLSSTIISNSSLQADALSTISFILGPKKFSLLLEKDKAEFPETQYIFIDEENGVFISSELNGNVKMAGDFVEKKIL